MKKRTKSVLVVILLLYGFMFVQMNAKAPQKRETEGVYLEKALIKEWREEAMFRFLFPYLDIRKNVLCENDDRMRLETKGAIAVVDLESLNKAEQVRREKIEIGLHDEEKLYEETQKKNAGSGNGDVNIFEEISQAPEDGRQEKEDQLQDMAMKEGQTVLGLPVQKKKEISAQEYSDTDKLIRDFFVVDESTSTAGVNLSFSELMNKNMSLNKEKEGPQILILTTHSQEAFKDSIPGEEATGIMAVADHLGELLEGYGYSVYRLRGEYDKETRTGAYNRALTDLEQILSEQPQIQVILDVHRDDMKEENHLVTNVNGKPTAKFMFFNGLSKTAKNGKIDYLQNVNLSDNLAFSFQAKVKAEEYFPGVTRKNYLHAYRYNLHLRPKSMLIEIGAQNNTLEEEMNACEVLAVVLHKVLSGE